MIGKSHYLIAEQIAGQLPEPWLRLFSDYWYAVEVGLEIPDRFMIWHGDPGPPASEGKQPSKLVHRYYLDSTKESRGEMLQMILRYTEGIAAFGLDLAADEELREQTQDMMLYTGALIHFLSDLCTPLHVGSSIDGQLANILGKNHHQKIENRLWRRQNKVAPAELIDLPPCHLDEPWLLHQAHETYRDYLRLPASLGKANEALLRSISLRAYYRSVSIGIAWLTAMIADPALKTALTVVANSPLNPR